jgi:hypothetical protein
MTNSDRLCALVVVLLFALWAGAIDARTRILLAEFRDARASNFLRDTGCYVNGEKVDCSTLGREYPLKLGPAAPPP